MEQKFTIKNSLFWIIAGALELLLLLFWLFVIRDPEQVLLFFELKPHLFRYENDFFISYQILAGLFVFLATGFYLYFRKNALEKLGQSKHWPFLTQAIDSSRFFVQYFAFRLGMALLFLTLANPQYAFTSTPQTTQGFDLMVALDLSKSMEAIDAGQDRSRIERAKWSLQNLLTKLQGNRIGLVVFAGEAYTQLPLTGDYFAAKTIIQSLNTDAVTAPGTALGLALETAMQGFSDKEATTRAILLISDGEDHEAGLEEVYEKLAAAGIRVFTMGIGSLEGTPIPDWKKGVGGGYKKDAAGNVVISKLNEAVLQEMANKNKGFYLRSQQQLNFDPLLNALNQLEKTSISWSEDDDFESYFWWFLFPLFFLFLLYAQMDFIIEKKNEK